MRSLFCRPALRGGPMVVATLGLAGCFLVNPNISDFQFALPEKTFTVDASHFGLPASSGSMPCVPCSRDADCAMLDPGNPQAFTCQGTPAGSSCGGATSCAATVNVTLVTSINLQQEDPSFVDTIKNNPVVSSELLDVNYVIASDTLDFATPPIGLYVAPGTVMDPTNASAVLVGTIPPVPVGSSGTHSVTFAPGGQQAIDPFLKDYSHPFNVIASGAMTFHGGDPWPSGQLVVDVKSDAQVSCSGCQ